LLFCKKKENRIISYRTGSTVSPKECFTCWASDDTEISTRIFIKPANTTGIPRRNAMWYLRMHLKRIKK